MKKFALFCVLILSVVFALAQSDSPTVDETISTLQGGLTAIPLDAAISNIEGWQAQLDGSSDAAVQDISSQLGELKTALQADTIDGTEVGGLLVRLGEGTAAAAGGDSGLTELGGVLTQAGNGLLGNITGGMSGGMMSGGMMSGGMMSGGGM